MDIEKTLTSPVVIIGGVGLGIVLLLMRGASAAPAPTLAAYNPGFQIDSAGYSFMTAQAGYAKDLGLAQLNADVSKQVSFNNLLSNLDDHATTLALQRDKSMSGVINSMITSNAAIVLDRQGNAARLNQAWIAADVATHGQDTALAATRANVAGQVATIKYQTAASLKLADINANLATQLANINSNMQIQLKVQDKKIAAKNSDNGLLGGIVKAAASILPFFF